MKIKLQEQNIFFTSDLHFFHSRVIEYDGRPFLDVEHMNEVLVDNWNRVVGSGDIVFYLGDLSFQKPSKTKEVVDKLNGKIHYVLGNHDKEKDIKSLGRFESISDYINLSVLDEENPRKWQEIMMSHYPILSWDKAHYGSWMLHGHSHGNLMKDDKWSWYYEKRVLDVGVNIHGYEPLSFSQIKGMMSEKMVGGVDHN